jgi:acetyl esterase/lipase
MPDSFIDIKYATQSLSQKLDIYSPSTLPGLFPVILWLHPGGFTMGDKNMVKLSLRFMLTRGYAVVSANYRLADEAHFPAQIYDTKAAVRWIRTNATKYNFNPAKIAAWGVSAGGLFAALLGTAANIKELEDLSLGNPAESSQVSAVVAIISPIDFLNMDSQLVSLGMKPLHDNDTSGESLVIGGQISRFPERCKAISPMTYITADSASFYLQQGTADEIVPYLQSVNFAKALTAAIGKDKVDFNLIDNANHFDPIHNSPDNMNRALDFLDKCLKT